MTEVERMAEIKKMSNIIFDTAREYGQIMPGQADRCAQALYDAGYGKKENLIVELDKYCPHNRPLGKKKDCLKCIHEYLAQLDHDKGE